MTELVRACSPTNKTTSLRKRILTESSQCQTALRVSLIPIELIISLVAQSLQDKKTFEELLPKKDAYDVIFNKQLNDKSSFGGMKEVGYTGGGPLNHSGITP